MADAVAGTDEDRIDYWSFVEFALRRVEQQTPGIDLQATRLFMTLRRATELTFFDIRAPVRAAGMSVSGFSLMYILFVTGEIGMKKLIELSGMSKASVSSVVRTLAADGFLNRVKSDADGRNLRVSLTEHGQDWVKRVFPEYNVKEREWAALLSPEDREHLVRILTQLMDGRSGMLRRS